TNVLNQQVNYGNFFTDDQIDQNYAVIGSKVAAQLFGIFNPVGHSLTISGKDFLVGGIFTSSSGGLLSVAQVDFNSSIFIPLPIATGLTGGHTNLLQILAKSK